MDATLQIQRFQEFIEAQYHDVLLEAVRKGDEFLVIDFRKLAAFDIQLADSILDQPEDSIKAGEIAVGQFDLPIKLSFPCPSGGPWYLPVASFPDNENSKHAYSLLLAALMSGKSFKVDFNESKSPNVEAAKNAAQLNIWRYVPHRPRNWRIR